MYYRILFFFLVLRWQSEIRPRLWPHCPIIAFLVQLLFLQRAFFFFGMNASDLYICLSVCIFSHKCLSFSQRCVTCIRWELSSSSRGILLPNSSPRNGQDLFFFFQFPLLFFPHHLLIIFTHASPLYTLSACVLLKMACIIETLCQCPLLSICFLFSFFFLFVPSFFSCAGHSARVPLSASFGSSAVSIFWAKWKPSVGHIKYFCTAAGLPLGQDWTKNNYKDVYDIGLRIWSFNIAALLDLCSAVN